MHADIEGVLGDTGHSESLLPCPFCGSVAHIIDMNSGRYHIKCSQCPCTVGSVWGNEETIEYLIKKWKTRFPISNKFEEKLK